MLQEGTAFCKENPEKVIWRIPYLKGAVFGSLSTNRWTTVEKQFIETISHAAGGQKHPVETIDFLCAENRKNWSFYMARGMENEIRYAAEKIKTIAEKENYGTVSVYYSSPEYSNFLKAVFDAEKIPYSLSSGRSAKELHLTQFFISLLESAEKDFSYELLEKVVRNRVITFDNVLKALKESKGVSGRAEVLKTDTPYSVVIDYAHTPDGLDNIIKALKVGTNSKVITLFGCGGDRDRTKRPKMGKVAQDLSDFIVID